MTDLLDAPAIDDAPIVKHRRRVAEPLAAVGAMAFMWVVALVTSPQMLEPDDYAYRASIAALRRGELLLTSAQYHALQRSVGTILQWHHLSNGDWISEKNPGYPFLAVLFDLMGIVRATPLIFGSIAAVALYLGGRRWLGRWGGTAAVALFATSGAALAFAWRATMPTFTDASLIATGAGLLLWSALAVEQRLRRRTIVASLAGLSLMLATFVRYTDLFVAIVAAIAILWAWRRRRLPRNVALGSLVTMAIAGAGILVFNATVYGHAFSTGYSAGEISFSLSAIPSNLVAMPLALVVAMPMTLVALVAVIGIVRRRVRGDEGATSDLAIAGSLVGGWAAMWLLYLAYPWTVGQHTGVVHSIHVIRFYVPVIGLVALLGAWALVRWRVRAATATVLVIAAIGVWSFSGLISGGGPGGPGGPGGFPGGSGGIPGGPIHGQYGPPPGGGAPPGSGGFGGQ